MREKSSAIHGPLPNILEETYPDAPSLFGGAAGRALTLFVQDWAIATLQVGLINLIVLDIWQSLSPEDKDYFRASREKRFGRSLEEVQAGREERLPSFQKGLMYDSAQSP